MQDRKVAVIRRQSVLLSKETKESALKVINQISLLKARYARTQPESLIMIKDSGRV